MQKEVKITKCPPGYAWGYTNAACTVHGYGVKYRIDKIGNFIDINQGAELWQSTPNNRLYRKKGKFK
jgi:hypothetical protein